MHENSSASRFLPTSNVNRYVLTMIILGESKREGKLLFVVDEDCDCV